jgi:hypothetical protein
MTCTTLLGWSCCVELSGDFFEDQTMNPTNFGDPDTLVCTLSAMLYKALQRSQDPALEKAMNPLGLVLPWECRSAQVRNFFETTIRATLQDMSIIGDSVRDLHIYNRPAALELEDGEAVIQ